MLYSHHAYGNIVRHIASSMKKEIAECIITNQCKFSIMIDESTSVSNVQSIIVFIRLILDDSVCTYFFGLVPLAKASAASIFETLISFFNDSGLSDAILSQQLVGFCSDGAISMIGQYSGVATLLKARYPIVQSFHCMAHRLELAVKNAVDTVNVTCHFRCFVDELYKVYSMSPKNQAELESIAETLCFQLLKVQKVFDFRWVLSSFVAVRALLRDFPALFKHFSLIAEQLGSKRI
jgi:hypothetical protein